MIGNSKDSSDPASENTQKEHHGAFTEEELVKGMNETLEEKPLLKQYFYDFLVRNNSDYKIFSHEDAKEFRDKKRKMQTKMGILYLGTCCTFTGIYAWRYGLKRKSSIWSHTVKLMTISLILPAIPAHALSIKFCENDRNQLLEIAEKYPVQDEKIFRDFIAYAIPAFKEKFYNELDKKKKEQS